MKLSLKKLNQSQKRVQVKKAHKKQRRVQRKIEKESYPRPTRIAAVSRNIKKDSPLKVKEENIPSELKSIPQWVCWEKVNENGKESKIPIDPKTGRRASVRDPTRWSSFRQAVKYCDEHHMDGIGLVLTENDPFWAIDLDNVRNPKTKKIKRWAKVIIKRSNSYTETSPSGTGIRILGKGSVPGGGRRGKDIEIYGVGHYVTITGRHHESTPSEIMERSKAINDICAEFFQAQEDSKGRMESLSQRSSSEHLTDEQIIERAKAAKNGKKFTDLWEGNTDGYRTPSEADQALATMLVYWVGNDRERIDRLFRKSGLMRKKSERQDYRDRTISRAIASAKGGYSQEPIKHEDDDLEKRLKAYLKKPKKATSKIMKDSEVMSYLTTLLVSDLLKYETLLVDLKEAGVTSRGIDSIKKGVNSQKKGLKRLTLTTPLRSVRSYLPDAPVGENILIPPGWDISRNGVLKTSATTDEKKIVARVPVLIKRKFTDIADDTGDIEVVWWEGGKWKPRIVTRQEISDTKLIVGLSAHKFPVTSVTARLMVDYLDSFRAHNDTFLPDDMVTHEMGWQGKGGKYGFMFGKKLLTISKGEKVSTSRGTAPSVIQFKGLDNEQNRIASGFCKKGDLKGWSEVIPLIESYPMATFAIYASLSSILNFILHSPNFILDWSAGTSSGKTTILEVAASCFGNSNQKEKNSIVRSWDATNTYLERFANVLKNLPLFVDDTQRIRNVDELKKFMYAFSSGQGGGRAKPQGVLDTGTWETVALSCGESKITSFTIAGGTLARVISLRGFPFKEKSPEKARLAENIKMIVRANYGHIAPIFVRYLMSHRAEWEEWRKQHRVLLNKYGSAAGNSEIAQRQAEYFASIHMAARLAKKALGFPFNYPAHLQEIHRMTLAEPPKADRADEAYQMIQGMVLSQRSSFYPPKDGAREPRNGWLGIYNYKKDLTAIVGPRLTEILKEHGYDPNEVTRAWAERELLNKEGEEVGLTRKVKLGKSRPRAYLLKMDRSRFTTKKSKEWSPKKKKSNGLPLKKKRILPS
jgi:putative DNA primase/helicase